jgi:hypothetical protein
MTSSHNYASASCVLIVVDFLFIFDYLFFKKIIIYFTMIYFINKENSNMTYNFTHSNKYFE